MWDLVAREAQRDGVSAAEYVREATIARVYYTLGVRGDDPEIEQALRTIVRGLRDREG